ncbi:hypothetical protein [Micromonospora mirobrigensis]|uniref:PE family protein n=1 Tax=Micromonospora mirobrigensis TaxID=262898 RepID=A0A1C4US26_9ACTN|nr:hypothetical protein [Micromonospora mirobrigensis]SCE74441.1 hypothetical protein GA0070564_101676 [Micromonospora mirobrigensis]
MIPQEDRPTSWLSDYGGIEADIRQLREFAERLEAEVRQNYAPHLSYIADDMTAAIPNPCDSFQELVQFLHAHHETQQATADTIFDVRDTTGHLAAAAGEVAARYAGSDAFSAARVTDVERALADPSTSRPGPALMLTDPDRMDNRGEVH